MQAKRLLGMLLAVLLLGGRVALAQVTTGTILGTVSDATGAVVPAATITLKNVETGVSRTMKTDEMGRYRAPQLTLGNFEVAAEAAGFQAEVRSGITLTVGREAVIDFTLQVGAVTERVTVIGEAPLVESTNATVSDLVSEKTMREIPLNGRSFTDLTALQPGVVTDLGVNQTVFSGGGRTVINGARPQQSLYLLDGTDIVSPYQNLAPVSVMNQTLGVDTIREFTVLQNNYGAQYGRAIGGVVNAVTRSGTNTFRGSAFEFLRNSALDAKNFFDRPGKPIPPFQRNQFGATFGGPVVRDHTFFFFSYEALRERLGITDVGTVLSEETRLGQITGCPSGARDCTKEERSITATVPVNPEIVPIINLFPRGNGRYLQNGLQEFLGSRKQPGRENYLMFRVDQRLSDTDSVFGRMTMDNSSKELPAVQFLPDGSHPSLNDRGFYGYFTLEWTRVLSPSLLHIARFGFVRNNNRECHCIGETQKLADEFPNLPRQLQIVPGKPFGGPHIVPGVTFSGGGSNNSIGGELNNPMLFIDNTFDYTDSVRITQGRHSLDLGVNVKRYQQNALISTWSHGQTNWLAPLQNFLTAGTCSGCGGIQQLIVTGVTRPPDNYRGWRQTYGS